MFCQTPNSAHTNVAQITLRLKKQHFSIICDYCPKASHQNAKYGYITLQSVAVEIPAIRETPKINDCQTALIPTAIIVRSSKKHAAIVPTVVFLLY